MIHEREPEESEEFATPETEIHLKRGLRYLLSK